MARTRWKNDQHVEAELRPIISSLGYFPSNSDLSALGRSDLANQINKRGGFIAWARRTGAARQHSDSDTGWLAESAFKGVLQGAGIHVEKRNGVKCPYDLLANGVLRIDVKGARYATYGAGGGWYYRIAKYVQSDVVVLYQLDADDWYALPWWECPTSNITVSRGGGQIAHRFRDWALLNSMLAIRTAERERLSAVA